VVESGITLVQDFWTELNYDFCNIFESRLDLNKLLNFFIIEFRYPHNIGLNLLRFRAMLLTLRFSHEFVFF